MSVGSRRYNECQTLAFDATTDRDDVSPKAYKGLLVDPRTYPTPRKIIRRQDVKTAEEAKDCSVDKLQLDRKGIDDMMQNVNENGGDDRATRNDPRSLKVLVTSHTNDKILNEERVKTKPKESSRVVTPTVERRTDCEESDRGQRRSIYRPDGIPTMDSDGQKQSRNQSDMTARDEEER